MSKIINFVNYMIEGKGGSSQIWNASKLIPLKKKNNNGIRPIAISDVWVRLIGRLISSKMAKQMGEDLKPIQFAM